MRKTNGIFYVFWSFENFDFFPITYQKNWRYNTNIRQILNSKGQLILKANCQAKDSSKKWTNEFVFTSMRRVFVRFLEEIEDIRNAFRN